MNEVFGKSRKLLLRYLLRNKSGAAVDELAAAIDVTRTAVRQHLASLMSDGLVSTGAMRPSGGRPQQLFVLTDAGREAFPRHYSWFAQLLVEEIEQEHGTGGLRARLGRIAATVVSQLKQRHPVKDTTHPQRVQVLSGLMDDLGYDARTVQDATGPAIEADNCVFHELAMRSPEVCQFDLALLSSYTGAKAELTECMARGGHVCRFRFAPRK